MSEAIEIPIRLANMEAALAELERAGKKAREETKKTAEAGEVLKNALKGEVLAAGINRLSASLHGAQKDVAGIVSATVQGLGQGGPVAGLIGGLTAIGGKLISIHEEYKKELADILALQLATHAAAATRYADEAKAVSELSVRLADLRAAEASGGTASEAARARQIAAIQDEFLAATGAARRMRAALDRGEGDAESRAALAGMELTAQERARLAVQQLARIGAEGQVEEEEEKARIREQAAERAKSKADADAERARAERLAQAEGEQRILFDAALAARREFDEQLDADAEDAYRKRQAAQAEEMAATERARQTERDLAQFDLEQSEEREKRLAETKARLSDDIRAQRNLDSEAAAEKLQMIQQIGQATLALGEAVLDAAMSETTATQAQLDEQAKRAAIRALFAGAEAALLAATGNIPGAIAAGFSAAQFAAIAGITVAKSPAGAPSESSVGSAPSSSSSRSTSRGAGTSGDSPTFIIQAGSGVHLTRDELARDVRLLFEQHERRR